MNSTKILGGAMAFTVSSFLAFSSTTARAEERVCRGTIGAATVDNLRVPQGATCKLNGTRVKGTVKVEINATLSARNVMVIGNVQAENARLVAVLERSRIGGRFRWSRAAAPPWPTATSAGTFCMTTTGLS